MEPKNETLSPLSVPTRLRQEIRKAAEKDGRSVSSWRRVAYEEKLKRDAGEFYLHDPWKKLDALFRKWFEDAKNEGKD